MKRKISIIKILALTGFAVFFSACSDFLEQEPDQILSDEQVFEDEAMIQSVLANFYGRVTWGQNLGDSYTFTILDEAGKSDAGPDNIQSYADDLWRVYDYELIRNMNQFLQGLRETAVIDEEAKLAYEGEVRFLRAWLYFNMCKGLGGMPIVGDEVFEYGGETDVTALQYPRSTEAGLYDYIIEECEAIADLLPEDPAVNAARATKWAAHMLKARAAVYAGSIANYNNKLPNPVETPGGEVGIPADRAQGYYEQALAAAEAVITSGVYSLNMTKPDDLGRNFYEATSVKENNSEVIWARDHKYPGQTVNFTTVNIPATHAEDIDRAYGSPILNLVEDFEYIDDRDGTIHNKDAGGNYIFYDNPEDAFAGKDARLWGTVIYPGAVFKGTPVPLQAGQKYLEGDVWNTRTGQPGDNDGITSVNGPTTSNERYINKSGFFFRKFLDENGGASTRGRNSEMWFPRFRYAEALMIACEASFELGRTADALKYINQIRRRAGIQELTSITFDDIVQEYRVEFAFEDHRYWDLKRWRLAHIVWNGVRNSPTAQQFALFPYQVDAPGTPYDGKWVFDKQPFSNSPNPRNFQMRNYYNFLDQQWLNNNPKLVRNPYQ